MAHSLISKRLLEIISNRHAENAERPGSRHFQISQGHFHGHQAERDCWTSRPARWRVEPSSDEAPAVGSHLSRQISATAEVEIMPLPIDLSATVSMAWHLRATSEPALAWFIRELLIEAASDLCGIIGPALPKLARP
jgi:hypothetical protein